MGATFSTGHEKDMSFFCDPVRKVVYFLWASQKRVLPFSTICQKRCGCVKANPFCGFPGKGSAPSFRGLARKGGDFFDLPEKVPGWPDGPFLWISQERVCTSPFRGIPRKGGGLLGDFNEKRPLFSSICWIRARRERDLPYGGWAKAHPSYAVTPRFSTPGQLA